MSDRKKYLLQVMYLLYIVVTNYMNPMNNMQLKHAMYVL